MFSGRPPEVPRPDPWRALLGLPNSAEGESDGGPRTGLRRAARPLSTMGPSTVVQLFVQQAQRREQQPALREKHDGQWRTTTWGEWFTRSRHIAAALCDRGLEPGDRVAIAAQTRLPWVVVDVAIWLAGAVSVAMYPTVAPAQARAILRDARPRFIVVDSADHAERMLGDAPLAEVIVVDPPSPTSGRSELCSLGSLERRGRQLLGDEVRREALRRRWEGLGPENVATVVYGSATTGEAKGVALTHGNLTFETASVIEALDLGPDDEQLLFLPLAHIFGRMLVLVQIGTGMVTSFAGSMWHVLDDMAEINPTLFASVPRLFEKIHSVTEHSTRHEGPLRRRLVGWAGQIAESVARAEYEGRRVPRTTALQHRYADRLLLRRIRRQFGSRLRYAVSGGAPLSEPLARWFYAAGVLILEVYGLTECTGGATINRPDRFAFGSVGQPLPGVEVKISSDGEVLLRGPNVMQGYWKKPATPAVDEEGWLHTGDLGELRLVPAGARGETASTERMLFITGRSKDLLVTAGGSNVAPLPIEQGLEGSPWIRRAVVFGEGRPYLVALLTLDREAVARWAEERDLRWSDDAALGRHPEVRGLLETEIELCNQGLNRYETIKRFAVLERDLSVEEGELTDTLKVRRQALAERHGRRIAALYEDGPLV